AARSAGRRRGTGLEQRAAVDAAIEPDVQICARNLDLRNTFDRGHLGRQLRRDALRILPELARELERRRERKLAVVAAFGLLQAEGKIDSVTREDVIVKGFVDSFFNEMKHGISSITAWVYGFPRIAIPSWLKKSSLS